MLALLCWRTFLKYCSEFVVQVEKRIRDTVVAHTISHKKVIALLLSSLSSTILAIVSIGFLLDGQARRESATNLPVELFLFLFLLQLLSAKL